MKSIIYKWIAAFYDINSIETLKSTFEDSSYLWHKVAWISLLLIGTLAVSLIIWWITKTILLNIVHAFALKTKTNFDDLLVKNKFFRGISHLVPLMFLDYFFSIVFFLTPDILDYSVRLNEFLIIFVVLIGIRRLLKTVGDSLMSKPTFQGQPINAYIQTINIVITLIFGIIMLSLLTGQSPLFFLTSLGAMTAILILVFKDTILGFVGSIQMTVNDMVRLGDWVTMEKFGADGDVIEINLTTVKVQNWDKTITTIPTYSFISDSFKNWRGMSNAGGRRIKRAVNIRIDSIKFASPRLIEKLSQVSFLSEFIHKRQLEIEAYNKENQLSPEQLNARKQTNIGLFRKYLDFYLKNNHNIRQDMTIMVRQLASSEKGLPIEIYCFTNTIAWLEYEEINSDIFDHIFAVLNEFELEIHEQPTGKDFKQILSR